MINSIQIESFDSTADFPIYGDISRIYKVLADLYYWNSTTELYTPISGSMGSVVTAVNGTVNRITSTGGTTPTIDISATFEDKLTKIDNYTNNFLLMGG